MNKLKIYLATSCLQTRPMKQVVNELLSLEPYGLQLCAGNVLWTNLKQFLEDNNVNYLQHHNFSWDHYARQDTWKINNNKLIFNAPESNSVHPPMIKNVKDESIFWDFIYENINNLPILEAMYPNEYYLADDKSLIKCMDLNLKLAIDVSHIFIQKTRGTLSEETWQRVQTYKNIKEIHVSSNRGLRDTHQPMTEDTFGLEWAKDYASRNDIPLVLECYMHKLSIQERKEQLNLLTSITNRCIIKT